VALENFRTQILLLHSEQGTLDSLSTGFNDSYTVHCTTSGIEALTTLGDTPIHVIVSAQDLPGMSGLEALREAKKRSPDTIGILLADNESDNLEALVGDQEVFQIVRGNVTPDALRGVIDSATQQVRLLALAESANDTAANVDEPASEHIVMETAENGSAMITDNSARIPTLKIEEDAPVANVGTRAVDVLVLTRDDEFLATIRDSSDGLHNVHFANTIAQAAEAVHAHKIGVAVIDAGMAGPNVEELTLHLRTVVPRLVAIVAGRRDDGDMLMNLINRGKVYRFLLKPVSSGRVRLAVQASAKHHLEAPDTAFAIDGAAAPSSPSVTAIQRLAAKPKTAPQTRSVPPQKAAPQTQSAPPPKAAPRTQSAPPPKAGAQQQQASKPIAKPRPVVDVPPLSGRLLDAFDAEDTSFTETMTGIVRSVGESFSGIRDSFASKAGEDPEPAAKEDPELTHNESGGSFFQGARMLSIGAVALIVVAGLAFWIFGGTDGLATVEEQLAVAPQILEAAPVIDTPAPAEAGLSGSELLAEARLALGAGQIYDPPGSNAIELYLAASAAFPNDAVIANEMGTVIEQALSDAESALLERRADNADAALKRVALADPENARLPFLKAQMSQIRLRSFLDDARLSIRESRFEDAAIALTSARSLDVPGAAEIDAVDAELGDARSQQHVDDVLAQAAASLEEGKLLAPSNDNARYYYELVLSNDPQNASANQGLSVIASQLALLARTQIDRGNFSSAEALLADARNLDPSSSAVSESSTALVAARNREVQAARDAVTRREAAEKRSAEERIAAERAAEQRVAAERAAELRAEAARILAEQQAAVQSAAVDGGVAGKITGRSRDDNSSNSGTVAATNVTLESAKSTSISKDKAVADTQVPDNSVARATEQSLNDIPIGISGLTRRKYVAPKYPRSAQRRKISGWVDVVFIVTTDGTVRDITVRDSKPNETFVAAATKAVEGWEFEPVIENNRAVEKRAAIRMLFAFE
jgi:TonB family protein